MDSFNTTGVLYTGLAAAGVATVVSKFNSWRRVSPLESVEADMRSLSAVAACLYPYGGGLRLTNYFFTGSEEIPHKWNGPHGRGIRSSMSANP